VLYIKTPALVNSCSENKCPLIGNSQREDSPGRGEQELKKGEEKLSPKKKHN